MIGTLLNGRFRIVKPLGTGNFGKTFLAEDTHIMDAKCAVKRLTTPKDSNDIDIVRDKFKLEAKKLHALNHQGIPKLISYFEYEGEFYLAQDLIDGHTLDEDIYAHKKWTELEVKNFLLEMLEILAYVHSQGSIHRDIKPNNIMLRHLDKKLMLIDFGAVKEVRNTGSNLEVGQASGTVVIGTTAYMSPEQAKGKPCFASDLYSLGCIAIEALIGKSPDQFESDPYSEILWRDQVRVSDDFAAIIDKMVRYKSGERYRNAGEVLAVLQGSQAVIEQPIKEVEKPKTKKPPVAKQAPKAKPVRATEKVVKESNTAVPNQATQKISKSPIDFSKISTRRKFIIGLAAATPLAIMAWESLKPKPPVKPNFPSSNNPPVNEPIATKQLQNQTLNNIITVDARGQEVSRTSSTIQYFTEDKISLPSGAKQIEMALIPAGNFTIGSPNGNESPQKQINFTRSFYMSRYEVTQKQWIAVMGSDYDRRGNGFFRAFNNEFNEDNRPIVAILWDEAKAYCKKLSELTGRNYRLPSESEWEYSCRANTKTPFHFGETITAELANINIPPNHKRETTNVGSYPPNEWGLHDMHGNVWEWCEDTWHDNYNDIPSDGSAWINGGEQDKRALRGGSCAEIPIFCRSAGRFGDFARISSNTVGFRVVVA